MLTRLAVEWSSTLVGMRLDSIRQENAERFRLGFTSQDRDLSLIVCLDPVHPWMGEAVSRWDGPRWTPDPFVTTTGHALSGRRVAALVKQPAERAFRLDFGDGRGVAIELAPHGANLVHLGEDAAVVAAFRLPKGARERLLPGRIWTDREVPGLRLDPFRAEAATIDNALVSGATPGEDPEGTLQRLFLGVGPVGAELTLEEHAATGRSVGTVLRERLDSVLGGVAEILIEEPDQATEMPDSRLLPWRPVIRHDGMRLSARHGPAATTAFFYEARDAAERGRARIAALGKILRSELTRTRAAEQKVKEGLAAFADPDRFQRMGEALLASLISARRSGDVVVVPDPYDSEGREIVIPAPPHKTLPQVADDLFRLQRRSRRGLTQASSRAETLARRSSRLEALLALHDFTADPAGAESLETAMRKEGLPVGLAGPTRAARAAARLSPPKLGGVRMLESIDGFTILVGRTGPDNDRLTFKIAAPEDIWLHAAGVHGAHVVIRNPERIAAIPPATLAEAARIALWFSDARAEAAADVHWTRRKNVRRAKGGASGLVVLKRFETLRVRPKAPPEGT